MKNSLHFLASYLNARTFRERLLIFIFASLLAMFAGFKIAEFFLEDFLHYNEVQYNLQSLERSKENLIKLQKALDIQKNLSEEHKSLEAKLEKDLKLFKKAHKKELDFVYKIFKEQQVYIQKIQSKNTDFEDFSIIKLELYFKTKFHKAAELIQRLEKAGFFVQSLELTQDESELQTKLILGFALF